MLRACALGILTWCLLSTPAAAGWPIEFRITFQPTSWLLSPPFWSGDELDTTFTAAFQSAFTINTSPLDRYVGYGTLRLDEVVADSTFGGTSFSVNGQANYALSVQCLDAPCFGSAGGHVACSGWAYDWNFPMRDRMDLISSTFGQTTRVDFSGGSMTVEAALSPGSHIFYKNDSWSFQMRLAPSFDLADPSLAVSVDDAKINTLAGGQDASPETAFCVWNQANALVESLSIDYGDGQQENIWWYSQLGSLVFEVTATHTFNLSAGEDRRSITVSATADGPSDDSPDDDTDTAETALVLLRSPLALAAVDGAAVPSGSVLDVLPGQSLAFDASPSIGYIETVSLILDESVLAWDDSCAGDAHETFQHTFDVPDLPAGTEMSLEYEAQNAGAGANADTWAVTLNLVPEPATLSLLAVGALALMRRRRR